jgi:hypothetical protein
MTRVTQLERDVFHAFLDIAIDKMNEPKNCEKSHWHCMAKKELVDLLLIESLELRHAVYWLDDKKVLNECKDVINFASMIADNAISGRG